MSLWIWIHRIYFCEFSGYYWVHLEKHFFQKTVDLPEDMIIYCAYDVVPLLQLYGILRNSIQEDFQTLLHDLTQDILIRPVDEKLVKLRNRTHKKQRDSPINWYSRCWTASGHPLQQHQQKVSGVDQAIALDCVGSPPPAASTKSLRSGSSNCHMPVRVGAKLGDIPDALQNQHRQALTQIIRG